MNPISSNNLIPLVLIGFFEEAASCMARGATSFAHRTNADSKATISITSHELGVQHLMPAIGVVSMVILVGGLLRYFWPQTNTDHSTNHKECNGAIIINNNLLQWMKRR